MKKFTVGEIISGRVTEISQNEGVAENLVLNISENQQAIIPITELPEANNRTGQQAMRHLARKYMNRTLMGVVINENPLTLSYQEALKTQTEKINFNIGDEVTAKVVWANKNQAELEYKGVPLTLYADEYGWLKHVDLRTTLKRGEKLKAEVIEITEDKILVSHKKYAYNPWPKYLEKYSPRNQYLAKVKNVMNVGVVVSLEPGLDILCSPKPFFDVKIHDEVAVEIVDINPAAGKMKGLVTAQANR